MPMLSPCSTSGRASQPPSIWAAGAPARAGSGGPGSGVANSGSRLPITRAAVASAARSREPRTVVRTPLTS